MSNVSPFTHVMADTYFCPNCKAPVALDAPACNQCQASFVGPQSWKPQTLEALTYPPPRTIETLSVALGITFLLATIFPVGSRVAQAVSGGMYGRTFKGVSPAIYLAFSVALNYLPVLLLVALMLHYFGVIKRVPTKYRSTTLFGFGAGLIVLYTAVRVLAAAVPGGGAGFAVASLSPFVLLPAIAILAFATVRFCIGVGAGRG